MNKICTQRITPANASMAARFETMKKGEDKGKAAQACSARVHNLLPHTITIRVKQGESCLILVLCAAREMCSILVCCVHPPSEKTKHRESLTTGFRVGGARGASTRLQQTNISPQETPTSRSRICPFGTDMCVFLGNFGPICCSENNRNKE